jgi:hypothetical protein
MHAAEGQQAGDMPNLDVPQSGELTIEVLNAAITSSTNKRRCGERGGLDWRAPNGSWCDRRQAARELVSA